MAMGKCKECGNEVSTKAEACPKCGAVLKKEMSCLGCVGVILTSLMVLLILVNVLILFVDDPSKKTTPAPDSKMDNASKSKTQKIYKEGDMVKTGYTSYAIWRSWWSSRLSQNEFLDNKPDAMFLFIDLTVRNDDKKARNIPPFKLIDENGAEYETTSKGYFIDGAISELDKLNPSVKKQGIIIFDVPQNHSYNLKLSGGYWSGDNAFVKVTPK